MTIFSLLEQPREHLDLQMLMISPRPPEINGVICEHSGQIQQSQSFFKGLL